MPTGGAVKLTIDADKYGWVEFPDGTMQVTVDGKIDTTYTGVTGSITYYVPKDSVACDLNTSDLAGSITSQRDGQFDLYDCILLKNVSTFNSTDINLYGCALSVEAIGSILLGLDLKGNEDGILQINEGSNRPIEEWAVSATTAYDSLIVKGWTIYYNTGE